MSAAHAEGLADLPFAAVSRESSFAIVIARLMSVTKA